MYLWVQYLSKLGIWGSGLWSSMTDTSLQRKPGCENWENTSQCWSLETTTVQLGFFFYILAKTSAWGYASSATAVQSFVHQQSTSISDVETWKQQLWKTPGSPRQQQLHSHSMTPREVWALCNSLPSSSLNCTMYLFQGMGTANFNEPEKSIYYQAFIASSDIKTWIFFL